ncbi:MAG: hypothetical protein ABH874_06300 [Methanobacteriota archaeon]|jgi:hypothetical protein|nr:hypothetical protein [Candidatus Hydrothermarchaeota archaeon]
MTTTVAISKEIRNTLMALKFQEGYRNLDSLIADLLTEHKKRRLIVASDLFKERMKKKGLTLENLG